MSFLAPLWLMLGAAVGIPLLLHLMRRNVATRVEFPAARYLQRAEADLYRTVPAEANTDNLVAAIHVPRLRAQRESVAIIRSAIHVDAHAVRPNDESGRDYAGEPSRHGGGESLRRCAFGHRRFWCSLTARA